MIFNETNTFCISLTTQNQRWQRMLERFNFFNIKCHRWTASTPKTLTSNFLNYLNNGQRACAQSHIDIWNHMLHNNIQYAMILEDDAVFHKDWISNLKKVDSVIDNDPLWDCIFLNVSDPISPRNKWVPVTEQYLTGGYIINLRGIKYILHLFHNGFAASDWMTTRLQQRGHSYSYYPWLIIQEGEESTIGSNCDEDHKKVLRCLNESKDKLEDYI